MFPGFVESAFFKTGDDDPRSRRILKGCMLPKISLTLFHLDVVKSDSARVTIQVVERLHIERVSLPIQYEGIYVKKKNLT